jgi:hypothetical protein
LTNFSVASGGVEAHNEAMDDTALKRQELCDVVERLRSTSDPGEINRLGEQVGQMIFGSNEITLPYAAVQPPSIVTTDPVTKAASGEQR